ncbi:hypothetical protein EMCG_09380 [[Emmonsia] crescens]|uniref:Uncharacterized protein n=1 Tax=[Emmonsia] crescens TaxID=73230 RepID=A0A0G2I2U6_9EURO|nr:hypothetical protein EMCG_09380 [Emmonsia crescens UAMH 3008]
MPQTYSQQILSAAIVDEHVLACRKVDQNLIDLSMTKGSVKAIIIVPMTTGPIRFSITSQSEVPLYLIPFPTLTETSMHHSMAPRKQRTHQRI